MLPSESGRGTLFVLAAAVLWGTTGTAQALAPDDADPISVGALRLIVGGVALLMIVFARGTALRLNTWPLKPTLITGTAIAAYQLCFFGAVSRTGVAVGTIVGIGSAPIIAGLLAWWLNAEKPDQRWWMATILAILGCALLTLPGTQAQVDFMGIVLAFGAGLSYALYALYSKRLLAHYPPDAVMAVVFCLGALVLAPLLLITGVHWLDEPRGWLVVLHLGLVTTALAYVLFARGLAVVLAATAVTLSLAEPLTAGLLGVIVIGETLTIPALFGMGLLISGLALLSIRLPHLAKSRSGL